MMLVCMIGRPVTLRAGTCRPEGNWEVRHIRLADICSTILLVTTSRERTTSSSQLCGHVVRLEKAHTSNTDTKWCQQCCVFIN